MAFLAGGLRFLNFGGAVGKRAESELLDRIPPSDVVIEKRIIGLLLVAPETFATVVSVVTPKHFHGHNEAGWYSRISQAREAGVPMDMELFLTWLREHHGTKELKRLGGPAYLAEAMHNCGVPSFAKQYATVIREHATRRAIIDAATQMLTEAYAADMPLEKLIERIMAWSTRLGAKERLN